jgi:hypothetical protein
LVGAGAIGQAFAYALGAVGARGHLTVFDHEKLSVPNLQRYVLAFDADTETSKVSLVTRALKGSGVRTTGNHAEWDLRAVEPDKLETVCAAVDTEAVRIALQASLPRRLYNAWTQPADIGWSRHENFGMEPCLACLYWPTQRRLNYHQLIARAIGEHELRTLAYLTLNVPVDVPLPAGQVPQLPDLPAPPDASKWSGSSLLSDIALRFDLCEADLVSWKGRLLSDLYHEGVCAGALIRHQSRDISREVAVPLAHQSALAGVMLATQLLTSASPQLAVHRHKATEGRLNLLSPFPQLSARPRMATPNCICADTAFLRRYAEKW